MKFAVIGCGNIAKITWAPDLASLWAAGWIEQVLFYDADPSLAAEMAATHNGVAFPSLDALLAEGPGGIVVATPPAFHAELAIRALNAGAHVVVEKPFTQSAEGARTVLRVARDAARTVSMPFHQLLMAESALACLRRGEIGDPQVIDYYWRRAAPGAVSALADVGSHAIAMACEIADGRDVLEVTADRAGNAYLLTVRFDDDLVLRAWLEFGAPIEQAEQVDVRITGSLGELCFPLRTMSTATGGDYRPRVVTRASDTPVVGHLDQVLTAPLARRAQVERWVTSVLTPGASLLPVTGERALQIQLIEDAAARSCERPLDASPGFIGG